MEMIDRIFAITQDNESLKKEKSFFKRLKLKHKIKEKKIDIISILEKKEFDVADICNLAWVVEFGKVKWPNKELLIEGSEINYFDGPYVTVRYNSTDLSLDIVTDAASNLFEVTVSSKKVTQHKTTTYISEDTGVLDLVREILKYPVSEILYYLTEGDKDNDKHVHVPGSRGNKIHV